MGLSSLLVTLVLYSYFCCYPRLLLDIAPVFHVFFLSVPFDMLLQYIAVIISELVLQAATWKC